MKIAVTGATGYIGTRFVREALRRGFEVLAVSRRPFPDPRVSWQPFRLEDPQPFTLPRGTHALVHLAAQTDPRSESPDAELRAALYLRQLAGEAKARWVFASSQAARADAPSAYGRAKWLIEQEVLGAGGIVLRLGLVYGGETRGLFGTLCQVLARVPLAPRFVPAPLVQPVHVDEAVEAFFSCLNRSGPALFRVGLPVGVPFHEFLKLLARFRLRRKLFLVPVPSGLFRKLAAVLPEPPVRGLSLSRLASLLSLPPMATADDLRQLGVSLRPLWAGLSRSGSGRRAILEEGIAVLRYLSREPVDRGALRRYARAVISLDGGPPLVPRCMLCCPLLLALMDGNHALPDSFRRKLEWRLLAAAALQEATPRSAPRNFGLQGPKSLSGKIVRVVSAGSAAAVWLALRWLSWPIWKIWPPRTLVL